MTEKRYYAHKHLLQENQVHDKICHNFMNIDETVEHMNNEYWKYKQLKEVNEQLKKENRGLQFKIIDMLDFIKDKGSVTREEIKEWWNNKMKDGDK